MTDMQAGLTKTGSFCSSLHMPETMEPKWVAWLGLPPGWMWGPVIVGAVSRPVPLLGPLLGPLVLLGRIVPPPAG